MAARRVATSSGTPASGVSGLRDAAVTAENVKQDRQAHGTRSKRPFHLRNVSSAKARL